MDLAPQILHLLTARTLHAAGFDSASTQSTLTLSAILGRYLVTLGQAALENAQDAGRRVVAADDLVMALEDVGGLGAEAVAGVLDETIAQADGAMMMFDGLEEVAREFSCLRLFFNDVILPKRYCAIGKTREGLSPPRLLDVLDYLPIDAFDEKLRPEVDEHDEQLDSDMEDQDMKPVLSDHATDSDDESASIKGQRIHLGKRSYAGLEDFANQAEQDPYEAPYLPPLPHRKARRLSATPSFPPSSPEAVQAMDIDDGPSHDMGLTEAAAVEQELTSRRANRSLLDAYISLPISYNSSALKYSHHAPGVGTGFNDRSAQHHDNHRGQGATRPPVPDTLNNLIKAYHFAKLEARDPAQSKSARSYRATLADIISHTTNHPAPYLLASGTNQIPGGIGDGGGGGVPKGCRITPAYALYANNQQPVNAANEKDSTKPQVYPTRRLGVTTQQTLPPTLALSIAPLPVTTDPTRPALLQTLLTEFPGHQDPNRETFAFPRSSWLKPTLLRQFTHIDPPVALPSGSGGGGPDDPGVVLYGEGVRAPGQADLGGDGKAAKRARNRLLGKSSEPGGGAGNDGETVIPKIKFTLNKTPATAAETTATDVQDGSLAALKDKPEIILRATWPLPEDRDWQTPLDLPHDQKAAVEQNMIAYGQGKRPVAFTSEGGHFDMNEEIRPSEVFYPQAEASTSRSALSNLPGPSMRRSMSVTSNVVQSPGESSSVPAAVISAHDMPPPPLPKFKLKVKTNNAMPIPESPVPVSTPSPQPQLHQPLPSFVPNDSPMQTSDRPTDVKASSAMSPAMPLAPSTDQENHDNSQPRERANVDSEPSSVRAGPAKPTIKLKLTRKPSSTPPTG